MKGLSPVKSDSHFVNYWLEEKGETAIVNEKGFISYKIYDNDKIPNAEKEIMICEFYVAPEYRGTRAAKDLADQVCEIGVKNKCTHLSCYIQHPTNCETNRIRTTYKMNIFIRYGMIVHSMNETQILMYKNLPRED